jgi:polysaccharide export outer membrane protein
MQRSKSMLLGLFIAIGWATLGFAAATTPSSAPLPAPDLAAMMRAQEEDYRIGPLDTLEITVFQVDTLNRTVQVDASGQVNMPLVGAVPAAGKTAQQLADAISARLTERYLQSAQVSVFVKQSLSQRFTVEGAVRTPGVYAIQGRMTLLQAIATAQGVEEAARLKKVVIFRMIDQKRRAAVVNLNEVRTGASDDPQIYAGDVIVVPRSNSNRILRGIIGVTPLVAIMGL